MRILPLAPKQYPMICIDGQDKGCFDCSWYNIFAYKTSFSQKLWSMVRNILTCE